MKLIYSLFKAFGFIIGISVLCLLGTLGVMLIVPLLQSIITGTPFL